MVLIKIFYRNLDLESNGSDLIALVIESDRNLDPQKRDTVIWQTSWHTKQSIQKGIPAMRVAVFLFDTIWEQRHSEHLVPSAYHNGYLIMISLY